MRRTLVALALVVGLVSTPAVPADPLGLTETGLPASRVAEGTGGAVATDSPIATGIAVDVLRDGGNAIDAAIAATFALGVVRPEMCGIGGGGFLVYRGADGEIAALDFRERAPMHDFQFGRGIIDPTLGVPTYGVGHNVVGVPGVVAGMQAAHARYGSKPWDELVEPARETAEDGFPVAPTTAMTLANRGNVMRYYPESSRVFFRGGVAPYLEGDELKLPDLAATLETVETNPRDFYDGDVAEAIAEEVGRWSPYSGDQGSLTTNDLRAYEAKWRDPLVGSYRGRQVITMPPPTSGGVATLEILNLMEGFDPPAEEARESSLYLHRLAESQKIAWADRAVHVGDPDFTAVPERLTAKGYARQRRTDIDDDEAADDPQPHAGSTDSHTTHVSVVDGAGNAVSTTCSIEQPWGSGVVVPGTGILLNNQLTDFDDPDSGTANAAEPGKRPRSSMSPTIVVHRGRPVLVVGAAGGANIIMGVVQAVLNVVDFDRSIGEALHDPRIEARCDGTALCIEVGQDRIPEEVAQELEARGHTVTRHDTYRSPPVVNATGASRETRYAVSEPRAPAVEQGAGACCR